MLHQPRISKLLKRTTLVLLLVSLCSLVALASPAQTTAITSVTATTSGQSTLITVSGTSPLPYSVSRPDARTIFVELPGVDMTRITQNNKMATSLVEAVSVEPAESRACVSRCELPYSTVRSSRTITSLSFCLLEHRSRLHTQSRRSQSLTQSFRERSSRRHQLRQRRVRT